jgi:hypothetical protein
VDRRDDGLAACAGHAAHVGHHTERGKAVQAAGGLVQEDDAGRGQDAWRACVCVCVCVCVWRWSEPLHWAAWPAKAATCCWRACVCVCVCVPCTTPQRIAHLWRWTAACARRQTAPAARCRRAACRPPGGRAAHTRARASRVSSSSVVRRAVC